MAEHISQRTFEAELSQINWDVADFPDTGLMVTPGKEQVEELDILGYISHDIFTF